MNEIEIEIECNNVARVQNMHCLCFFFIKYLSVFISDLDNKLTKMIYYYCETINNYFRLFSIISHILSFNIY